MRISHLQKIKLVCIFVLISQAFKAQIMFHFKNDSLIALNYVEGDEFNGQQLDADKWTNGLPWSRVIMSQDLAFSQKNVEQKNGLVNFIAIKKDSLYKLGPWEIDSAFLKSNKITLNNNEFLTKYSVGCIVSKNKYSYGYHEIRFKVEEGQGVWPAFWFYGGIKNEEIDAFELKGERNDEIHIDTHCPYGCDRGYKNKLGLKTTYGGWMPITDYLHNGFNVMGLEWLNGELIWYINGYPLAYFKGKFETPMNLYLNTSVAKDGGGFKPGPNEKTKWPNTYSVDYYRYWKPATNKTNLILKKQSPLIVSDVYPSTYSIKPKKKRGLMYSKKKLKAIEGNVTFVYTNDHKLQVIALGKLTEGGVELILEGNNSKKTQSLKLNAEQQMIELNKLDTGLKITFVTADGNYMETLNLQ
jgi:beta-glucanase (GH16 family)